MNNSQQNKYTVREFFEDLEKIKFESLPLYFSKMYFKMHFDDYKKEDHKNLKGKKKDNKKYLFLKGIVDNHIDFKLDEFSRILRLRTVYQLCILKKQGYKVLFNKSLKTAYRLVIGLGSTHVSETSLTLHHIFGIPYIPATALKGVVRMASFWEIAKNRNINDYKGLEELQKQLYNDLSDSDNEDSIKHKLLFGTQGFKGLLVFLDTYPNINKDQKIFELDIINVHYGKYYRNNEPPGDWDTPKPIIFLTVKKGIPFRFYVLFDELRARRMLENKNYKKIGNILKEWINGKNNLKDLVERWIGYALKEFGVGAKTRLGYGIFE